MIHLAKAHLSTLCILITLIPCLDGFSLFPPCVVPHKSFPPSRTYQSSVRSTPRLRLLSLRANSYLDDATWISSLTNEFVKRMVKLRDQAKFRKQEDGKLRNLILLEEEEGKPWHEDFLAELNTRGMESVYMVPKNVFKKIVGVESADGRQAAAVIGLPAQASLEGVRRVLVLDRIQDPGNVGTLLRTAAGLGWEGVWVVEGSCDPFNDKTLRAAKGACWRLHLRQGGEEELLEVVRARAEEEEGACEVLVADMGGAPPSAAGPGPERTRFLVLSNEGAGVSPQVRERLSDARDGVWKGVGVELEGGVESLNVAVAGAILMFALR